MSISPRNEFHPNSGYTDPVVVEKNHEWVMKFGSSRSVNTGWKTVLRDFGKEKHKIIAMNTGTWFGPLICNNNNTLYELHFADDSPLSSILKELSVRPDVTIVWRDTAPGGMCYKNNQTWVYDIYMNNSDFLFV